MARMARFRMGWISAPWKNAEVMATANWEERKEQVGPHTRELFPGYLKAIYANFVCWVALGSPPLTV
jgi:hypothetical protein